MSACGLRKPQLKATRQSYNPHWQPRDQPVLNWTVCYSACNSFQVTITHPQVDFSLFQREKKETWQLRAVSPTNHQLFLALLLAPPKKWLFSPRRYRWLFSKGLVCMLSGLNCSTMASSEGIQDSMRWQLDRSTQPPPPCAVSMSFMAWQAREVEKFVPCGKRKKNRDEDYGEMRRLALYRTNKSWRKAICETHISIIFESSSGAVGQLAAIPSCVSQMFDDFTHYQYR